jgi:predicted tellurium resistance membrane protein TerC
MGIESVFTLDGLLSLLTLTVMEIILGIDNVIFISVISDRLSGEVQRKARLFGILGALIIRVVLLSFVFELSKMSNTLFTLFETEFSWSDIILIFGGLFLVYKSTAEIFEKLEGEGHEEEELIDEIEKSPKNSKLTNAIIQIILLDIVFSFDSILTAVGMSDLIYVMIIAVVISMVIMLYFAKSISDFINQHPSVKVLALAFLLLIGILLIAEGFDHPIPKGYIYFAFAFSIAIEMVNMYTRKKSHHKKSK